jgi:hypothetical protein
MDQVELHRKLIVAARRHPPSERVPHAFERRILARLRACQIVDHWALWSRALWCAAAPCVGIMLLLLGAWWWRSPASTPAPNNLNLSQDFENTVLAAAEPEQPFDLSR